MSVAVVVTSLGNAGYDGNERDLTMTVDRLIEWTDTTGGVPDPKPIWTGARTLANDMVDMKFTAWLKGTDAAVLDAFLPPYAGSHSFDLRLPGTASVAAVPGFGVWDSVNHWWLIRKCTMNAPVECLGQKGPIVDLWGYRFDVHFAGGGASLPLDYNERGGITPTPNTTPPATLSTKFMAHQIQDYSRTAKPLPVNLPFTGVKHGRRRDGGMALDHLSIAEMDALVLWYRSIGGDPFTLASVQPFGPGQPNTCQAIARGMEINRVSGWWEASLDLTLYQ
jgi:hypothetical protein